MGRRRRLGKNLVGFKRRAEIASDCAKVGQRRTGKIRTRISSKGHQILSEATYLKGEKKRTTEDMHLSSYSVKKSR